MGSLQHDAIGLPLSGPTDGIKALNGGGPIGASGSIRAAVRVSRELHDRAEVHRYTCIV